MNTSEEYLDIYVKNENLLKYNTYNRTIEYMGAYIRMEISIIDFNKIYPNILDVDYYHFTDIYISNTIEYYIKKKNIIDMKQVNKRVYITFEDGNNVSMKDDGYIFRDWKVSQILSNI